MVRHLLPIVLAASLFAAPAPAFAHTFDFVGFACKTIDDLMGLELYMSKLKQGTTAGQLLSAYKDGNHTCVFGGVSVDEVSPITSFAMRGGLKVEIISFKSSADDTYFAVVSLDSYEDALRRAAAAKTPSSPGTPV